MSRADNLRAELAAQRELLELGDELARQQDLELQIDYVVDPRPLPPELAEGVRPMGHIAFMGDFDAPKQPQTTPVAS